MKKLIALILALSLVFCFAMVGCGSQSNTTQDNANTNTTNTTDTTDTTTTTDTTESDWAYIEGKGTLNIGITEFAPANYYDANNKLIGFDTEYAEAVCEMLGLEPNFIMIDWDSKELELKSKNIDCIWNMLSVTEERKEFMEFSVSYLANHQVVVIQKANADKYTDVASLNVADLNVVAEEGSAGEESVLADVPACAYTPVAGQTDALLEVMAGTADFAIVDYTTANSMVGEGTSYTDLMMIEGLHLTNEVDAIGFRVGSDAVEKFNDATKQLFDDGTMQTIAEKYDMADLLELGK